VRLLRADFRVKMLQADERVRVLEAERSALAEELLRVREHGAPVPAVPAVPLGETEALVPVRAVEQPALSFVGTMAAAVFEPQPPSAERFPDDVVEAIYRRVTREVSEELERVAPWLYEPVAGDLDEECTTCGSRSVKKFGVPFRPEWGGATSYFRIRCLRCNATFCRLASVECSQT
jgi:hypothetical protein